MRTTIHSVYSSKYGEISVTIISLVNPSSSTYEKDNQDVITYSADRIEHYIMKNLDRYYANIHSEGNGDVSIWFEVEATGTMKEIGALSIRLQQRSNNSSTWRTIKTYSYTEYSNMLANDKRFYVSNVDYSGISGYSYGAYVII